MQQEAIFVRSMLGALLCAFGLGCGTGCGHTGGGSPSSPASGEPHASSEQRLEGAPEGAESATSARETTGTSPKPSAKVRAFYSLALHPERAELRQGTARVLDFGEASGAQYTFGGWLTGAGANVAQGDDRALLVPGKVLKLALPIEHEGSGKLALRVRGLSQGTLGVHLNGERIGEVTLSGKGYETFELELPAAHSKQGENLLQLRASRLGASPRGGTASVLVDWMRVGPSSSPLSTNPPPALATLAPKLAERGAKPKAPSEETTRAELIVPAGYSLAYSFEVPAGALLRGTLASGKLRASLSRDGAPDEPLALSSKGAFEASLAHLEGKLVRLTLAAAGAEAATLRAPEVVVPQAETHDAPAVKNLIVVLIDTLRADKLEPYNAKSRVKTPGLNTFLRDAAVMLNARTQENWTKPSVATLLSSLLPWEHNAFTGEAVVPASVEMLPELLRARGFATAAFIANGYVSDKFGFKQGWDSYRNYIREGRRTIAQEVAKDIVGWLDDRDKDKPFFLYVHTIDPHVPYRPPESFLQMYDPEPYAGPVDFRKTNELLEKIKIGSIKLNARDKVRLEALYDGEISYHDVHFAAMLKALEERGLHDETMIVVTADHGEEFWDHGSVGHGHSVYDELLRVPMIVRIPGLTDGKQRLPDAVGLVDVMPTALEAMGQEVPSDLSGQSFLRELRGHGSSAPRAAVSGFMQTWRTVGVGRYKLLQRSPETMTLYDVAKDPGETQDIAASQPLALRYTRALLGLMLDGEQAEVAVVRKKRVHKEESTTIDAETEAQLRALGYVGSSKR